MFTSHERKDRPLARGLLDYFPDALMEVAYTSKISNDQHNPGQELHWNRSKSTDHADCILRHLIDRGTLDTDGVRHSAKVAWRALALLQTEIENERFYEKSQSISVDELVLKDYEQAEELEFEKEFNRIKRGK